MNIFTGAASMVMLAISLPAIADNSGTPNHWVIVADVNPYVHVYVDSAHIVNEGAMWGGGWILVTFVMDQPGRSMTPIDQQNVFFNCRGYAAPYMSSDIEPVPSGTILEAVQNYACNKGDRR